MSIINVNTALNTFWEFTIQDFSNNRNLHDSWRTIRHILTQTMANMHCFKFYIICTATFKVKLVSIIIYTTRKLWYTIRYTIIVHLTTLLYEHTVKLRTSDHSGIVILPFRRKLKGPVLKWSETLLAGISCSERY